MTRRPRTRTGMPAIPVPETAVETGMGRYGSERMFVYGKLCPSVRIRMYRTYRTYVSFYDRY